MAFHDMVELVSRIVEAIGIATVGIGAIAAAAVCFFGRDGGSFEARFTRYRQWLGRAILLGLEFLVAADIIGTVTIAPSVTNVAILAGIVLIRTFLSVALAVEVEGRWPWEHGRRAPAAP